MPKSLDTTDRIVFVLASDADKPKATQPRLIGQVLTLGRQRKLMASIKRMQAAKDPDEQIDAALDAVEICLSGWENFGQEYSREALVDVLTLNEIREVIDSIVETFTADGDDLKKSESPQPSAAANSVSHVVGDVPRYLVETSTPNSNVHRAAAMVANGASVDFGN